MNKFTSLAFCVFIFAFNTINTKTEYTEIVDVPPLPFITTWETTALNETIKIPMTGTYTIDWGDGTTETVTNTAEHIYATAGTQTVSISGGATRINFNSENHSKNKILTIQQWGDIAWGTDLTNAFQWCINLNITATDAPDLSNTTKLTSMFYGASSLTADLSNWDLSSATDMQSMFHNATNFNGNISSWNVSKVTNMQSMFQNATSFNGNISSWNVVKLNKMFAMFSNASSFNQDISSWNVSIVSDMRHMFENATSFNQDLSSWDISTLHMNNGIDLFNNVGLSNRNYDKTLIGWAALATVPNNVNLGIITLKHCLGAAAKTTLEGKGWTISDGGLDCSKTKFITTWETTTANETIKVPMTGTYTIDWGDGTTETTTNTAEHIYVTANTYTVSISSEATRINFSSENHSKSKIKTVTQWGDINWVGINFLNCNNLNIVATESPDLTSGTILESAFNGATSFNGDISSWDVSKVTDMRFMFQDAILFNQDLSSWDISSLVMTNGTDIFKNVGLSSRNYDKILIAWAALATVPSTINLGTISLKHCDGATAKTILEGKGWTINDGGLDCSTSKFITTWETTTPSETIKIPMTGTYTVDWGDGTIEAATNTAEHIYLSANTYTVSISGGATRINFNSENHSRNKIITIAQWGNISWGADLTHAFQYCQKLNITATDAPDLSNTTKLTSMFFGAISLNADLSSWDVSKVTSMQSMFQNATNFNGNISTWNVSNVTTMQSMLQNLTSFNQDLSSWDVSKVSRMLYMFSGDTSFNQDLSSWDISGLNNPANMFYNTNISTENYDKILIGWANLTTVPSNINLGTISLKHCSGMDAKTKLEGKGWTINDGGLSANCNSWTGATDTDWATPSNWSLTAIPLASNNLVIPNVTNKPIIFSGTSAITNNITIDALSSLTINGGASLTMDGNLTQNGTFNINSDATTNGSLIVKGTATGNVKYFRFVTANADISKDWYLISSPVNGHNIAGFLPGMAKNGTKRGIAPYINTNGVNAKWAYYSEDDTPGAFTNGKGYTLKLDHDLIPNGIALDFVGTLNTNKAGVAISVNATGDQYNVIGNPYTSYIDGAAFLDNVDAGRLTEKTIWLWDVEANSNEGEYITKNSANAYKIALGQGFFVKALAAGTVNFLEAMQTHSGGDTFLKQENRPEIKLSITEGKNIKSTEIFYIENKTTGFDDGYDSSLFNGASNTFAVYTQLVTDNKGKKIAIQTLPNSNYENMVVPIGVNTAADVEITFSLNTSNFTSDLKIFLEDRETNTFNRLDEANSNYKITTIKALNGIGRFYIHTSRSTLTIKNIALENVSVFKTDASTLRITGLQNNSKTNVTLFNLLGKQVLNTSFQSNGLKDIALPKLATGVYVVKLQSDKGTLSKKIILE